MGYWMFIFNHQEWHELYEKNCSLKSQAEWFAEGKPHFFIGFMYFFSGLIFEISYIPFLIAMKKKEFFQYSSYKFMFQMGIIDMFVLPCNGIITGIQVMIGAHYCNSPKLFYFTGAVGVCELFTLLWVHLILAICFFKADFMVLQFLELGFPKIAPHIFGGRKAYLWMTVPLLYQAYAGFQLHHIFSSKIYAMHHDPFHFVAGMENNPTFNFPAYKTFFTWHNSLVTALLVFFYGGLVIVLRVKHKMLSSLPTVSKVQKQMTIQAICVCGEMLFAPLLHIFMLFWEFPVIVEIIAHFGWICLHGDTPIIYFLLNISLRKAVKDMLTPVFAMIKPIIPTSLNKISQNPVYSVSRGTVHAGDNNYVNSI